jgi:putative peptidoglycan lipid II flippase
MSARDIDMSAQSLRAYGLGLVAFMLIKVLATGFFSRQDTRTPVRIAVQAMTANMVFNLILIWPLAHAGLALATALSAFLNAGLLLRGLIRDGVFRWQQGWGLFVLRMLLANAALAALLLWLARPASDWLAAGLVQRAQWMTLLVVAGVAVYVAVLAALGVRLRHLRG